MAGLHHSPVAAPLAGGDLFVTEDDYVRYVDAVAALWTWLAEQLNGRSLAHSKVTPSYSLGCRMRLGTECVPGQNGMSSPLSAAPASSA